MVSSLGPMASGLLGVVTEVTQGTCGLTGPNQDSQWPWVQILLHLGKTSHQPPTVGLGFHVSILTPCIHRSHTDVEAEGWLGWGAYKAFKASSPAPRLIFEARSSVCAETETQDLSVLSAQIRTPELTRKGVCDIP